MLSGQQYSWRLLWVLVGVTAPSSEQTQGTVLALEPEGAPLVTQGHVRHKKQRRPEVLKVVLSWTTFPGQFVAIDSALASQHECGMPNMALEAKPQADAALITWCTFAGQASTSFCAAQTLRCLSGTPTASHLRQPTPT